MTKLCKQKPEIKFVCTFFANVKCQQPVRHPIKYWNYHDVFFFIYLFCLPNLDWSFVYFIYLFCLPNLDWSFSWPFKALPDGPTAYSRYFKLRNTDIFLHLLSVVHKLFTHFTYKLLIYTVFWDKQTNMI